MEPNATWYGGRPRPRSHCVRWEWDPATHLPKVAQQPLHFFVHVYCGQRAGWIKMPIGTEVCLGPRHIVLDGNPASHKKGYNPSPNFLPMSAVAKRLDELRCHLVQGRPRSSPHCVRWGPSFPQQGGTAPPQFFAHVYCGPTVAHLNHC